LNLELERSDSIAVKKNKMNLENIKFSCLDCDSLLEESKDSFHCKNCNREWKKRDGIPSFLEEDFYWGNLKKDEMEKLIESIQKKHWIDVVNEEIKNKKKNLSSYIFDEQRSAWRFFCPLNKNSRVLDIGSLWGTLPFNLAKECGQVVALDAVIENCRFMKIRKEQDNISNVYPVCANAVDLPFPEEYFDLIVLNGVLEWTGLSSHDENPLEIHTRILSKINKMLKKGGVLYIGIENRFGAEYFFGVKDPHTGFRFITILPRFLADFYSKNKRKKRYSEITHSYSGMKNLLRKCNFNNIDFFLPLPNYRHFAYFIPYNNNSALRYSVLNLMQSQIREVSLKLRIFFMMAKVLVILKCYFILKIFSPSFSIFARKGNT